MSFRSHRWLVLAIVSIDLFLIVIDMSVLYTALPHLTQAMGASAAEKLWIVNAYPLAVAGLLPGMGTLSDRYGPKRLFTSGLAVFGAASLAAAYAASPSWLIAARVLLAVGAAMMMPATLAIIRHTFTDTRERTLAIGIWAAVASGGAAFGPVVGGALLEHFWWGSVFLINVPIVLVVLPLGLWAVHDFPGHASRRWDLLGSLQILVGLVGVVYAVKEVSQHAPSYPVALAAALAGAGLLVVFVRRQLRMADPLIDFALFRSRRFSGAIVVALVASAAFSGVELIFSQWLQLVRGMSPLQAGLFILPAPLAAFVAGPVAGLLLPRVGEHRGLWMAMFTAGVGTSALALLYQAAPVWQLSSLAVMGFGLGAAMTAASSSILSGAPASQIGMAGSVEEMSYEVGAVLGVALMGSLATAAYGASLALPADLELPGIVHDSLDEALAVPPPAAPATASLLATLARAAFDHAFLAVLVATAVLLLGTAWGLLRHGDGGRRGMARPLSRADQAR
ncbi:MFS transporter [Bordetella petrii]|uniref:MFS transporter n=1 Tax=Bordetella petrii TaxID=94624 RepID=UPI001E5D0446|nr:MFS transporter [Bordetella petrii]MCD0502076.1 MFS transporter [Bordetella petrii]